MIKKSYLRVVRNAQGFKELAAIRLIKMCDFIVCFSNIIFFLWKSRPASKISNFSVHKPKPLKENFDPYQ
jgi:hypothetical protein